MTLVVKTPAHRKGEAGNPTFPSARPSSIPTVAAGRGLKEAWSKGVSRCTRTGSEAYGSGRAGL